MTFFALFKLKMITCPYFHRGASLSLCYNIHPFFSSLVILIPALLFGLRLFVLLLDKQMVVVFCFLTKAKLLFLAHKAY